MENELSDNKLQNINIIGGVKEESLAKKESSASHYQPNKKLKLTSDQTLTTVLDMADSGDRPDGRFNEPKQNSPENENNDDDDVKEEEDQRQPPRVNHVSNKNHSVQQQANMPTHLNNVNSIQNNNNEHLLQQLLSRSTQKNKNDDIMNRRPIIQSQFQQQFHLIRIQEIESN